MKGSVSANIGALQLPYEFPFDIQGAEIGVFCGFNCLVCICLAAQMLNGSALCQVCVVRQLLFSLPNCSNQL
jgi:hypothetical protein